MPQLKIDEVNWSTSIREYVREREELNKCIYCGAEEKLTLEHILPRSRGGPDEPSNAVLVCRKCNFRKGSKRLYEWFGIQEKDNVPRIAEGKYLKLLFSLHKKMDTLSARPSELCVICDLDSKCPEASKLTVYCLEGLFLKK